MDSNTLAYLIVAHISKYKYTVPTIKHISILFPKGKHT